MDFLERHIEALVFASPQPIKLEELCGCLEELLEAQIPQEDIFASLNSLKKRYESDAFSFEIIQVASGYQFLTKAAYQNSIQLHLKNISKKRLSKSILEVLSIVAYKQPITKAEVEKVRGVNSDYAIRRLLEKNLIEIRGKKEDIGRPIIYGTTNFFLEYFGINQLSDLPKLEELQEKEVSEIGDEGSQ